MSVIRVLSVPQRTVLASRAMNKLIAASLFLLLNTNVTINERSTLLPDPVAAILSQELSGEIAKDNLEYIARHHRMRGSRGFGAAADHMVKQLPEYGLTDARVEQFPADGKIFYGTQNRDHPGTPNLQSCGRCAKQTGVGRGTSAWRVGTRCR